MIQRIALYATLGTLCDALGQSWDSWGFWCVLGLFWASEHMSRREGYEQGMVFVATLPEAHLNKIRAEISKLDKE